jgi:ribonuclease P protein component
MITRSHRFHGYGSLRYIYRHGKTVRGPLCSLKYILNKRRKTYRVSVVVNKKVNKSAVARNRIRRRMYEVIRSLEVLLEEPYDLVFTIFSDQINELTPSDLDRLVKAQLSQAGVVILKK